MAKRHISPLTLRDVWDKLEKMEKEVKEIHEDVIAHEKEASGQKFLAMGFAVLAISLALLITGLQPTERYVTHGLILFFLSIVLILFCDTIGKFEYNIERWRKNKKKK